MSIPAFCYGGLDFVLTPDGSWLLIEANDHPIGLSEANGAAVFGPFTGGGFERLLEQLVPPSDTIALLALPDCFRLKTSNSFAGAIQVPDSSFDDTRIASTVQEFNALARGLKDRGHDCWICDYHGLESVMDGGSRFAGRVGRLYRRTYASPRAAPTFPVINDLRCRRVCGDKVLTYQALERAELTQYAIPTATTERAATLPGVALVLKPRWGAASIGVERVARNDPRLGRKSGCVVQPWIEPATLTDKGDAYHFDVRVYTVDHQPVAGFVRRSAAPRSVLDGATPLAWLTTTGPRLPLSAILNANVPERSGLAERLWHSVAVISRAIEAAVQQLDYDSAVRELPSFAQTLGIDGKVETLWLTASA